MTYVNRSGGAVYFGGCLESGSKPTYGLQRVGPDSARSSEVGESFVSGDGSCDFPPLVMLAPGDTLRMQIFLGSLDQPTQQPPQTDADRSGRFRVYLNLCTADNVSAPASSCVALPGPEKRSNEFLVLPP